jgi:hypothetical protein
VTNGKPLSTDSPDEIFDDDYYARVDEPDEKRDTTESDDAVPDDIVHAWEWRESRRLRNVHRKTDHEPPRCEHCRQPWPCTGIQMAGLAETEARGGHLPPTWLTWAHNAEDDPHGTGVVVPNSPRAIGRARPEPI